MNFSGREGHKKPRVNALESMDDSLKTALWNAIYKEINTHYINWGYGGYGTSVYRNTKAENLWTDFFRQNISGLPLTEKYLRAIENLYFKLEWFEVYDLIEFFIEQNKHFKVEEFNKILTKHNAAYSVINSIVQPISNEDIITIMESAYNHSFSQEIREHLLKAQTLYSNKKNPDFSNSCLESIKGVEGTCRVIFKNKKILGDNIKELRNSQDHNQHLVAILEKINAFRNNDIAHAKKQDDHTPTREDAILVHTICCGFINYFKSNT
ncbi:MAG TPA: hypothetical protein VLI69_05500 [Gammaproteobacteria bacterium]|nr:hypothetical protein [Gammaproteobacteria bacterium]